MKRLVFLTTVVGSVFLTSCMKDELKPVQKTKSFTEPTDPEEIKMKVNTFLAWMEADVSRDASGEVNIDEAVWLIEAGLNSEYDELQYVVGTTKEYYDSVQINLSLLNGLSESDVIDVYNFFHQRLATYSSDTLKACRLVDIEYSNSWLKCSSVYGEIDFSADFSRGFDDPFFVAGESYYAYTPTSFGVNPVPNPFPQPGEDNAASHIQYKLRLRFNIAYFPTGSYFTGVTGWYPSPTGTAVSSTYYTQTCPGYPGWMKCWGSPGVDALYYGISEGTYYSYTSLNHWLDEATDWINYNPIPTGKQVSQIGYRVSHAGELLDNNNPCYTIDWEFSAWFRWKYGVLVEGRE